MTTQERDRYEFRPHSLIDLRSALSLKQKQMAELIGVPQNTLSRWETGATAPDALNLAKVYSIAQERGEEVEFFVRRRPMAKKTTGRTRLLVFWDFQNEGRAANSVQSVSDSIKAALQGRFGGASLQIFKAFGGANQSKATDMLDEAGWRIWEDDIDMDAELISQARSDSGQEPEDTLVILITKDRDYSEMINDLQERGVEVYLGQLSGNLSSKLRRAVDTDHIIDLR